MKNRQPFANELYEQLKGIPGCKVTMDKFSDNSAGWIEVKNKEGFIISISFDSKFKKIENIEIFKDIYDVVDTQLIGRLA